MSDLLEPTEAGHDNLRRAVASLPNHEPDPATWPRIAAQLTAEQAIAQAVPQLPEHEPADELWSAILGRLDAGATPTVVAADEAVPAAQKLWLLPAWRVASIAAAVLLLLGVWWLRPTASVEGPVVTASHESIAISEEVVVPNTSTSLASYRLDPLQQQGISFIDAHCASLPTVCQSKEFRELRTQLNELEAQQDRLQQAARRFGTSPELVRQQAQLTTMRATITRELVQLIIS
ncbi:hypothetical protein [Hymenobacter crusticola]|uniref:Anti-sigma factor n=1 Tax=Hymenobacter crusticola TaxID=1770526 RepID=A0A243WCP2_9BACT|nr:hypothetical protein [Hymenobacter crusticola]OUJ73408.1 hypothetical protein BXP70_13410 [Hymenobacter crusticola]